MHRLVNLNTEETFLRQDKNNCIKHRCVSVNHKSIRHLCASSDLPGFLRGLWCLLKLYRQAVRHKGGKLYLMGSLVALSLTVEEKEEWVLSSNRKDSGGLTVSEQGMQVRLRSPEMTNTTLDRISSRCFKYESLFTFRFPSVFQQVFIGDREVASLKPSSLPVWPFRRVQLPGRGVGCLVIPNRTETHH